jgi:predicted  nucleic acid-binding Zn-ribbon protein
LAEDIEKTQASLEARLQEIRKRLGVLESEKDVVAYKKTASDLKEIIS